MRASNALILGGLALAALGYWLTTLGTQGYEWAPDWIWYTFHQRPTLVVLGFVLALLGTYLRARKMLGK